MIKYQNKYGTLELLPLDYRHVSEIRHKDVPADLKFDTTTVEQIALITDNRRIQLVPNYPANLHEWMVCHHNAPDTCAVCRIVSIDFVSDVDPQTEIQRCAQCDPRILV